MEVYVDARAIREVANQRLKWDSCEPDNLPIYLN